jgi:hypothetical protein
LINTAIGTAFLRTKISFIGSCPPSPSPIELVWTNNFIQHINFIVYRGLHFTKKKIMLMGVQGSSVSITKTPLPTTYKILL